MSSKRTRMCSPCWLRELLCHTQSKISCSWKQSLLGLLLHEGAPPPKSVAEHPHDTALHMEVEHQTALVLILSRYILIFPQDAEHPHPLSTNVGWLWRLIISFFLILWYLWMAFHRVLGTHHQPKLFGFTFMSWPFCQRSFFKLECKITDSSTQNSPTNMVVLLVVYS